MTLLKLVPPPALQVNASAVEILEILLEQAKNGQLRTMAYVAVTPEEIVTGWSHPIAGARDEIHVMHSGCAILAHRMTEHLKP